MLSQTRLSALRREPMASERIPCSAHVARNVVRTVYGDYIQVLRLDGASFQTADDDRINNWHERLNVLWRNIATPNVALWTHIVRRRARNELQSTVAKGFSGSLDARYTQRLEGESLMINELYLCLVYRPVAGAAKGVISRLLSRTHNANAALDLAGALDVCEKLAQS